MAQATFSVRMDEALKREFDSLCQDFFINLVHSHIRYAIFPGLGT